MLLVTIDHISDTDLLMRGMLTLLATATAQKGTSLPTSGGKFLVREFRPSAAVRAAVVAAQ